MVQADGFPPWCCQRRFGSCAVSTHVAIVGAVLLYLSLMTMPADAAEVFDLHSGASVYRRYLKDLIGPRSDVEFRTASSRRNALHHFCRAPAEGRTNVLATFAELDEADSSFCDRQRTGALARIVFAVHAIAVVARGNNSITNLSRDVLFESLARSGARPERWSAIDKSLPNTMINVLLATDGARQLITTPIAKKLLDMQRKSGQQKEKAVQTLSLLRKDDFVRDVTVREVLSELGDQRGDAIAILDFSDAVAISTMKRIVPVEGVEPSEVSIQEGRYPLARPLYFYINKADGDVNESKAKLRGYARYNRLIKPLRPDNYPRPCPPWCPDG